LNEVRNWRRLAQSKPKIWRIQAHAIDQGTGSNAPQSSQPISPGTANNPNGLALLELPVPEAGMFHRNLNELLGDHLIPISPAKFVAATDRLFACKSEGR
jgi:hypothetical protein